MIGGEENDKLFARTGAPDPRDDRIRELEGVIAVGQLQWFSRQEVLTLQARIRELEATVATLEKELLDMEAENASLERDMWNLTRAPDE